MATDDTPPFFDFEKNIVELETLVTAMERDDLSLEASLEHFERGIALSRACQAALTRAEQRVEQLIEHDDTTATAPFEGPD
jgi:exodeoxyribonuclease VII small subunit